MPKNAYTLDEVILCTYAALYDEKDFGGIEKIYDITNRSISSIKMKISNIAAMLDEEGFYRESKVSPLTGTPKGSGARRTDWKTVKDLILLNKSDFLEKCFEITKSENTDKSHPAEILKKNELELLDIVIHFQTACSEAEIIFTRKIQLCFLSSLGSKRFTILTGLAGSGKTKLAQAFTQWICPAVGKGKENPYYALVPVGADWMGNENILGYPNGLRPGEYIAKPALELILHAEKHPDTPHFLILDEMNLSHVERYFADILSAIESSAPIPLHRETAMKAGELEVPPSVALPANLFIIGTVNVDETTYMFSPKVLDRANVIEFRMDKDDLATFLNAPKAPNLDALNGLGKDYGAAFVKEASNKDHTVPAEVKDKFADEFALLFELLQKHNAEFGYRVAYEAARFMHFYKELGGAPEGWFNEAMDAVIVQKLLPKLHGSRSKLEGLLEALAWLCADGTTHGDTDPEQVRKAVTEPRYPLSFEKVMRMWEKLVRDQFVSFAEA